MGMSSARFDAIKSAIVLSLPEQDRQHAGNEAAVE
jgi:hypothetical protein